ncbi:MAG: thioesterase family protein [Lapillicoccus sp.]
MLALPPTLTMTVPDEFTDANGHMNIARYMEVHSRSGWVAFSRWGLGEEVALAGGPASFDAEHHLRYLREVRAGDEISVHGRVLGRSPRALHFMQFLVDRTTGVLANTFETVSLSIDLEGRRTVDWPAEVAARIDAQLAADTALDWAAPTSGAMGVR